MAFTKLTKEVLTKFKAAGIATGCASEHASTDGAHIKVDITADKTVEEIKDLFENCEVITEPYGPKKEHGNVMWAHVYHMAHITIKQDE